MKWIIETIAQHGDKEAVVYQDKVYTYTELNEQISAYAAQIADKINTGQTVAILSDYSFEAIALFFALYQNGNIIVPIATQNQVEVQERIKVSNATASISLEDSVLNIQQHQAENEPYTLVETIRQKEEAGLILFSSGSTGVPKAMVHNLDNLINSYQGKRAKKICFLIFLMFDHIGGLNTMFNCAVMGVKMVFPSSREADYIGQQIEKHKINILPASPTFLNLMLISDTAQKFDLSSLRMITYGTEPMPDSLLLKLKEAFGRVKFLQTFGTSETGIMQAQSKSSTSTYIKIDDPNTEYKIVENELWIRSKTQVLGYLNASMERFTEDGWFRTGDLVEQTEDGYIKIKGRNKEMINVGGEKVLPSEVESVLLQHELVKDCTVFGEKNPITGQMVAAKIFTGTDIKLSELKKGVQAFCADKMDKYKIPVRILKMKESEYSERFKKKRL